jgi:hypothetical protein
MLIIDRGAAVCRHGAAVRRVRWRPLVPEGAEAYTWELASVGDDHLVCILPSAAP